MTTEPTPAVDGFAQISALAAEAKHEEQAARKEALEDVTPIRQAIARARAAFAAAERHRPLLVAALKSVEDPGLLLRHGAHRTTVKVLAREAKEGLGILESGPNRCTEADKWLRLAEVSGAPLSEIERRLSRARELAEKTSPAGLAQIVETVEHLRDALNAQLEGARGAGQPLVPMVTMQEPDPPGRLAATRAVTAFDPHGSAA